MPRSSLAPSKHSKTNPAASHPAPCSTGKLSGNLLWAPLPIVLALHSADVKIRIGIGSPQPTPLSYGSKLAWVLWHISQAYTGNARMFLTISKARSYRKTHSTATKLCEF